MGNKRRFRDISESAEENDAIGHLYELNNIHQNLTGSKNEITMNNSSHLTIFSDPLKPLPYIALLGL